MNNTFTKEQALNIQTIQLEGWKTKLNKECYSDLLLFVQESNKNSSNPYEVLRGEDLTTFISNWKPKDN